MSEDSWFSPMLKSLAGLIGMIMGLAVLEM